jgi:glucose/arabinose dehydrogenase
MKLMTYLPMVAGLLFGLSLPAQQTLTPHTIHLESGQTFTLNLPELLTIDVAMQGMRRVRFLAKSPDGRVFVTDMDSLADNTKGAIYILEGWNTGAHASHTFAERVTYLDNLRNPNNVAFYTDRQGQSWLYFATTDKLLRYKYKAGDKVPTSEPEVLATYPGYGLSYKYGGWHLTRTVAFANLHGQTKLYVTVGSSCNACNEKEEVRATVSVMDPDGKHARILARGLRNAVGMVAVPSNTQFPGGALFATNMGSDHLGNQAPEDTFFELDSARQPVTSEANYGWPTCYFEGGTAHADARISDPKPEDHTMPAPPVGTPPAQFDCRKVPAAYTAFAAHSSPLGVEWFGSDSTLLKDSFLVALHGSSHLDIGTGYKIVRFTPGDRKPKDLITGFLVKGAARPVAGRPCGILQTGPDSFLFTDDRDGVVYSVHPKGR